MTRLRTLPIRVERNAGEGQDPWLETLAFRMRMPAGDSFVSGVIGRNAAEYTAYEMRRRRSC